MFCDQRLQTLGKCYTEKSLADFRHVNPILVHVQAASGNGSHVQYLHSCLQLLATASWLSSYFSSRAGKARNQKCGLLLVSTQAKETLHDMTQRRDSRVRVLRVTFPKNRSKVLCKLLILRDQHIHDAMLNAICIARLSHSVESTKSTRCDVDLRECSRGKPPSNLPMW